MTKKFIVYATTPEQIQVVRSSGAEILTEYASGVLIRCTDEQAAGLRGGGLEVTALTEPPVQVTGASFEFRSALEANDAAPISADANRTAYYLVKLIGPAQGQWLETIKAVGGTVHNSLPGYVLLVGIAPALLNRLAEQRWVESVTPYRPAMKVSPKLRPGAKRTLSAGDLERVEMMAPAPDARQQVEISVFSGESSESVAAEVRASGGMVLATTAHSVTAVVPPNVIGNIAGQQGVQAILPHKLPKFHNDRATAAMGTPVNHVFNDLSLSGTGQIVAVADSGLDTGNLATIHADFTGRVAGLVSFPNQLGFASNDPPPFDDGTADTNSAHGTHVAGSVAANGAAAIAAGSAPVPAGTAPEAQIYFQAIEQRVNWKTAAQLIAMGIQPPPNWPFPTVGLYGIPNDLNDLFNPAYLAGARIHTNSWGSDDAGAYTASAAETDEFMFNHRDFLILFSAGNEGVDVNGNGVIDADSIGSPGTAKNCLTVGSGENDRPPGSTPVPDLNGNWNALQSGGNLLWPALGAAGHVSDDIDGMAAFSSRGPTDDGRIKPDLTAPGTNVLSVRSSVYAGPSPQPLWGDVPNADPLFGLYCWSGGTSMSTPLVAGAAALIRQHLVQNRGHHVTGSKPSGALIKAFLINGAVAMTGQFPGEIPAGPNTVSGFGRVNLTEAIAPGLLKQTLFADEPDYAVESMQVRSFQVQAIDTAQPMKITLCWTDAGGVAGTGGLVNTLYLRVRRPDLTFADGDTTAFPTATNNVQQVTIPAPVAGTYEIQVHGLSITQQSPGAPAGPNPRQDFALAASNVMGFSLQPVSIAQAIDTTGSMASFGYMEPAKERANQLADFMRANDKLSVTEFSDRPAVPDARTPYALRLLGSVAPDWSDAHSAINALVSSGFTPIGAGLLEAWNQLSGEPPGRPRAIVLLSDGLNNVAPDPLSVLPTIPVDVPIFSVALGPAGSVSTLQDIANSRPNGGYFVVDSDEDIGKLHDIYAAIQALAAGGSMIGLSSFDVSANSQQSSSFPIEQGVSEITFALSWSAGREHELLVFDPDGVRRTATTTASTVERSGQTYRLIRTTVPKPGQWKVEIRNRQDAAARFTLSVSAQAKLEFSAAVTDLGRQKLAISARLLRNRRPFDRATVIARITAPARSRQEILDKFRDRIDEVQLPPGVAEPNATEEQLQLMRLAVFGQQFRNQPGGLFERKTIETPLAPRGNGVFGTEVPLSVPGNATVEAIARGEIDGVPWERRATLCAQSPEKAAQDVRPKFTAAGIVNAASFRPGIVPGSLASLFGSDLSLGVVGTELPGGKTGHRGTSVSVDGHLAPLLSVTDLGEAEQINFQVPFEVRAGSASVEVNNNGVTAKVDGVPALPAQPGIFEITLSAEERVAAVLDASAKLVSPENPARPGDIVSLYLTGAGPVTPPVGTGVLGPAPPSTTQLAPEVSVNGAPARILFSGYAPGFLGLFQINFEMPPVAVSSAYALEVAIGGSVSQTASIALTGAGRSVIGAT